MKSYFIYTLLTAGAIALLFSCKGHRYAGTDDSNQNQDSIILARANHIADSVAQLNYKPDTTYRLDTAKILSNPNYGFVHECLKNNCKQMEVVRLGLVNGFDKKIKFTSKKMWGDYVKLNAQLRDYATRNNIPLSNDTSIDLSYTNTMDGPTWDSTWIELVIRDDADMQNRLAQARKAVTDAQLQTLIDDHLMLVNKRIELATNLKKNY